MAYCTGMMEPLGDFGEASEAALEYHHPLTARRKTTAVGCSFISGHVDVQMLSCLSAFDLITHSEADRPPSESVQLLTQRIQGRSGDRFGP